MTIPYSMEYATRPVGTTMVNLNCPGLDVMFPQTQSLDKFSSLYMGSTTINTDDLPYGTKNYTEGSSHLPHNWTLSDTTAPFGDIGDISMAFAEGALSPNHGSTTSPSSPLSRASSRSTPSMEPTSSIHPLHRKPKSPLSNDLHHYGGQASYPSSPSHKRGRPRQKDASNGATEGISQLRSPNRSSCVPHKQIERKYREGLNMEFERLRRAIPTLPQCAEANVIGSTKPSKGMVLAAAIEYIGRIEREREAAIDEVERLGGTFRMVTRNASQADRSVC